jgi:glycosyltransferase involved in cell wall biosynthesis
MSEPTVSIIVPVYQRLEFLRAALASVFAQTFADWELIIADDGSGEPVAGFLRELGNDSRVTVIWLPHMGNQAIVRNAALAAARAPYVAFLDSDDVWLPRKLELQIARLEKQAVRWCYSNFLRTDSELAVLPEEQHRPWTAYEGDVLAPMIEGRVCIRTTGVIVGRELLLEAGGCDPELPTGSDTDLWLRIAQRYPIAVVDEPLFYARQHDENYSEKNWQDGFADYDRALEKLLRLTDARLHPLIRRMRATNAIRFAAAHIHHNSRDNVWTVLRDSFPHSWAHPHWWIGAGKVLVRRYIEERS